MKQLCTVLAIILIVMGAISMVTPIPGGVLFLAVGFTLLISVSPPARFCIQWLRARFKLFNKIFSFIETKVGTRFESIGNTLKLTDPGDLDASQSHDSFVESQIAKEKDENS